MPGNHDDARVARFWDRVQKSEGCWLWTGGHTAAGYGRILVDRRPIYAHRFSYELAYGAIPAGLEIDHICSHPPCVRPDHLRPATHLANMRHAFASVGHPNSRKVACPQGHPYTPENTYVRFGRRNCRICTRIHAAALRVRPDQAAKRREYQHDYERRPEVKERRRAIQRAYRARLKGQH